MVGGMTRLGRTRHMRACGLATVQARTCVRLDYGAGVGIRVGSAHGEGHRSGRFTMQSDWRHGSVMVRLGSVGDASIDGDVS